MAACQTARLAASRARSCGTTSALPLQPPPPTQASAARVPDGFCIPFAHYQGMMQRLRIPQRLQELQRRPGFSTDAAVRRDAAPGIAAVP